MGVIFGGDIRDDDILPPCKPTEILPTLDAPLFDILFHLRTVAVILQRIEHLVTFLSVNPRRQNCRELGACSCIRILFDGNIDTTLLCCLDAVDPAPRFTVLLRSSHLEMGQVTCNVSLGTNFDEFIESVPYPSTFASEVWNEGAAHGCATLGECN